MSGAVFKVTNPRLPRQVADPGVGRIAGRVAAEIVAQTPVDTGRLAAGWRVVPGRVPGVRLLVNDTPYAKYVEYGTRNRPATPAAGRVLARYRSAGAR